MNGRSLRCVVKTLFLLVLSMGRLVPAAEIWHFLPNFQQDIKGGERALTPERLPPEAEALLLPDSPLTEAEKQQLHWHPVQFPHRDFVSLMPNPRVYGWYLCAFDLPAIFNGMDVIADLGIIDDADETFANGVRLGGLGKMGSPQGSAWRKDRLYRIPAGNLTDGTNHLAVHVWSLWGSGGMLSCPVLKATPLAENAQWELAFASESAAPPDGLNTATTLEQAMALFPPEANLRWDKVPLPWKDYATWKKDVHYAIFRSPLVFPASWRASLSRQPLMLDLGPVFDVAAVFLNGKRLGLVGRFPEDGCPAFTEAASRARILVQRNAWAKDGHNELTVLVYRERGIGGLPGIPGILLAPPSEEKNMTIRQMTDRFEVLLQAEEYRAAQKFLNKVQAKDESERAWLLSHQVHLAYLKWRDGHQKDFRLLKDILNPMEKLLAHPMKHAPKQSAMQAFCHVLRWAEAQTKYDRLPVIRKYFPQFTQYANTMPSDRQTLGDWPLLYGDKAYILAAYGKIADWSRFQDPTPDCQVTTGVEGRGICFWQPQSGRQVENRNALVEPWDNNPQSWTDTKWIGTFAPKGRLFPGEKMRRVSWWDDNGEMHPFDDEGPDILIRFNRIIFDNRILSLYFYDFDWRKTLHPRQQSILLTDKLGRFWNARWIGKPDFGVYERFAFPKAASPVVRILKHRSPCATVAGLFLDRLIPNTNPYVTLEDFNTPAKSPYFLAVHAEGGGSPYDTIAIFQAALMSLTTWQDFIQLMQFLSRHEGIHPVWQYLMLHRMKALLEEMPPAERQEAIRKAHLACPRFLRMPIHEILDNMLRESTAHPEAQ